jgi:hypothetical protein
VGSKKLENHKTIPFHWREDGRVGHSSRVVQVLKVKSKWNGMMIRTIRCIRATTVTSNPNCLSQLNPSVQFVDNMIVAKPASRALH